MQAGHVHRVPARPELHRGLLDAWIPQRNNVDVFKSMTGRVGDGTMNANAVFGLAPEQFIRGQGAVVDMSASNRVAGDGIALPAGHIMDADIAFTWSHWFYVLNVPGTVGTLIFCGTRHGDHWFSSCF